MCADADPASTAEAIVSGAFGVAGQNCMSVQRAYVAAEIFDAVLASVVQRTRRFAVGSQADRGTDVGPMISEAEVRRVEDRVDDAVAAGARIHTGGRRVGSFYLPTVLSNVPAAGGMLSEEIFGPGVILQPFTDLEEAIELANGQACALQSGVFTNSIDVALDAADRIEAGSVVINGTGDFRIDAMPFGGFGTSGIGREGVRYALEAMTEPKNTIISSLTRAG